MDDQLKFAAFLGRWHRIMAERDRIPEVVIDKLIAIASEYPDYGCYRLKKAHIKITGYTPGGTMGNPRVFVNVIQGRDSIFPGMMMSGVPAKQLKRCDCGEWMPPNKDQVASAEERYSSAVQREEAIRFAGARHVNGWKQ